HHRALGHAGQRPRADMRAGEGEILVDLVGEQPEIVLATERGDRLDLAAIEDRPGRVVRTVDPEQPGPPGDGPREGGEGGGKAALRAQRDIDQAGTARPADGLV